MLQGRPRPVGDSVDHLVSNTEQGRRDLEGVRYSGARAAPAELV